MQKVQQSDIELWNSMLEGNQQSFELLYNIYYKKLINYGVKFTNELVEVEESIQDLFVKLWKNRANINSTTSVKYYLYRSFRRILCRKIKSKRIQTYPIDEVENFPFEFELSHDHELVRKERLQELKIKVDKLVATLTNRQKEAIFLRFYEDLSYQEIAELLEMNVGAAYKLIYRALDRLKDQLDDFSLLVLTLIFLRKE